MEKHPSAASLPRFVQHLAEASQFATAVQNAGKARKALVEIITKQIVERTLLADTIFLSLQKEATIIAQPDEDYEGAIARRERGNPPGKKIVLATR